MPNKYEIFNSQMYSFNTILKEISNNYSYLVGQRVYLDDMPRDEYMVYDMMDMLIHLNAILNEVASKSIYPDYMIEKLTRMKSYVDTTLNYFKSKSNK